MRQSHTFKRLLKEITRLKTLLHHDELTGVFNRRGFRELVEKLFEEIRWSITKQDKRKSFRIESLAILFIDLDRFKAVNDRYGHEAGDRALKHVAQLVSDRVRGIDAVGRWGGEEIVVALLGADERSAKRVAEDIRESISSHPLHYKRKHIPLSVSIGVAGLRKEKTISELISKADKAMYLAKKRGRNRVVIK